eukprot:TRINITY_DN6923_c0_g1_i1.p1 TRINITY_DN6923_c0_g1~~TRINITY_DN6923_c0_g1_i1.p1  ORF type:complete len:116 (-),score=21.24 TRINITY_DN6923_c0_g1_i1:197-544(-)
MGHGAGPDWSPSHNPTPKRIFSTTGGWGGHIPKHLQRGRFIQATVGYVVSMALAYVYAYKHTRVYTPGNKPTPFHRWDAHTEENHPDMSARIEEYKRTKKPLWKRILPTAEDNEL